MVYFFIETEEQFEFGDSVGHQAYFVHSSLPSSTTFDSLEAVFIQFINNETYA